MRWARNVEKDVRSYQVWRSQGLGPQRTQERLIAKIDAPATELVDRAVDCAQDLRYRLRAIDRDGLVSGYSKPLDVRGTGIGLEVEPAAPARPATPTSPSSPFSPGLELRWQLSAGEGWTAAEVIERRTFLPDRSHGEPQKENALLPLVDAQRSHRLAVILTGDRKSQSETAQVTTSQLTRLSCEVLFEAPAR